MTKSQYLSLQPTLSVDDSRTHETVNILGRSVSRRAVYLSIGGALVLCLLATWHTGAASAASEHASSYISSWRKARIGTQVWLDQYPGPEPGPLPLPAWAEALDRAKRLDLIPDIPVARLNDNGVAEYPPDVEVNEKICSFRRTGCLAWDDIVDLPKNRWAINFDDGPLPPSKSLYKFLDAENEKATHFWIGHNVKMHSDLAMQAVKRGDHLAVHSWSHPHLTTYTDEEVVGELGWAMKIIEDISGFRPKYYRPPYGDIDARVRALGKHVLGMTPVIWNADSCDWSLNLTLATGDFVDPPMDGWGMRQSVDAIEWEMRQNVGRREGVIILEHELSEQSVDAFKQTYPLLKELAWSTGTVAELGEMEWYQQEGGDVESL